MKLSQLFSGEIHTENISKPQTQQTAAQNAQVSRQQLSAYKPGQTISGEILSKSGGEVQIKLSDDMILNARVDQNINLEVGKSMIFEVKSNGSALTLSPLYTNVSAGVNVLKALDMAGIPVNQTSINMTEQLMAAGLSVNQKFLLQVYREINNLAQGEVSDVINLHKLGMQVNKANLNQIASYRNLTHQLMDAVNTILGEISGTLDTMLSSGDAAGAAKLYQELFQLVQQGEGGAEEASGGINLAGGPLTGTVENGVMSFGQEGLLQDVALQGENAQNAQGILGGTLTDAQGKALMEAGNLGQSQENTQVQAQNSDATLLGTTQTMPEQTGAAQTLSEQNISAQLRASLAGDVIALMDNLQLSGQDAASLRAQIMQFAQGRSGASQFFSNLQTLTSLAGTIPGGMAALQKILSKPDFKELLAGQLKQQWTIAPHEVADPHKVEELYQRLDSQLKALSQALESVGQRGSQAFQSVQNMSQNLDFMQQMNQMYAYVQLPLRLQQGDAHGELYVYANRKRLAEKDGAVSALLHLDMEHLGPVDVYVALESSKVNTKFYVRDDEMLDFLEAHMDILTERLAKRGYNCSFSMTTREKAEGETTEGGIEAILNQEKGIVLSQFAFDVRT